MNALGILSYNQNVDYTAEVNIPNGNKPAFMQYVLEDCHFKWHRTGSLIDTLSPPACDFHILLIICTRNK